jgi:hypothetical protein
MNKFGLTFKKPEKGFYDVYFGDVLLGTVYYDPDAWHLGRWFVLGEPQRMEWGGVNSLTQKSMGFYTRIKAANHLAKMKSWMLIGE